MPVITHAVPAAPPAAAAGALLDAPAAAAGALLDAPAAAAGALLDAPAAAAGALFDAPAAASAGALLDAPAATAAGALLVAPAAAAGALPAAPAAADERAARRDLCNQIGRLERDLARTLAEVFPRREPARAAARSASAQAGPRLLTLGQLERIRDELAGRVETLRANPGPQLLEQMREAPDRHRWVAVTSAELGLPGCRTWQVRPRLGLVGMLMGWWRVKVSSGCPLPG